jgi:hypothetical protein
MAEVLKAPMHRGSFTTYTSRMRRSTGWTPDGKGFCIVGTHVDDLPVYSNAGKTEGTVCGQTLSVHD